MADRTSIIKATTSFAALALVVACGGQEGVESAATVATTECVQVEEGRYIFQNGKFIRANATPAQRVEPVSVNQADGQGASSWIEALQTSFRA